MNKKYFITFATDQTMPDETTLL